MSAINCVVPEEILQLCGPSSENNAPTTVPVINYPLLQIKYHPAPKPASIEKKSSSITYIDEGMSILPFDPSGSHLINNNKARKNIKANWTRLAPKLLTQKGIKFDSTPEKSPEHSQDSNSLSKEVDESSSNVLGPISNKGDIPFVASMKEKPVMENDEVLVELPLSDDELDMPSSASELIRRLNLTTNQSINGVGSEDRKSECSSEITDLLEETVNVRMTRHRSKCESPAKGGNDSRDSISDISSTRRTTRSKASVVSVPVFSRPRTRASHGSDVDSHVNNETQRKAPVVKRSLRNSPNAKSRSPIRPKSERNGLGRKSVSLESLPSKSIGTSKELKRASKELKDSDIFLSPGSPSKKLPKVINDSKNNSIRVAESIENVPKEPVLETGNLTDMQSLVDSSSVTIIEESNLVPEGSLNVVSGRSIEVSNSLSAVPSLDSSSANSSGTSTTVANSSGMSTVVKKIVNGNVLLSNFNGVHINSPGRKRVPLSCDWDAAQEIAKRETAQALKALDSLDQMKGFKTRKRPGTVEVRRLSADNIPKSAAKKGMSPGIRRRTASILSSMASTFSQQTPSKQAATSVQPVSCVQGISPILPDKDNRSPKKGKLESSVKAGGKKSSGALKQNETQLTPKMSENVKNIMQGTNLSSSSQVKIEDAIDVDVVDSQDAENGDMQRSVSVVEMTETVSEPKLEICANDDLEAASLQQSSSINPVEDHIQSHGSCVGKDPLNQGLFLTNENLMSASSSINKEPKQPRRTYYKKQTEVNVGLMKLKMDFAMSRKGPRRISLPSKLSLMRRDAPSPLQSKDKVQDWKKKISLHLRKSPQRRYKYRPPNKLRESAKKNLASILRSGRNLSSSQGYQGDVEDCTEMSQPISEFKNNSGYIADNEGASQTQLSQSSSVSPSHRQTRSSHQSTQSDSSAPHDSKIGVLNEVRRSSRLSKEDVSSSKVPSKSARSLSKTNPKQNLTKAVTKGSRGDANPLQKPTAMLSTVQNSVDNEGDPSEGISAARFSDRLSERSRMITSKGTDNVLAQKSPNILSLMADAFKNNTVPHESPSTANILSSMAENFKKLDDATRISPSLSIQLVTSKVPVSCRPHKDSKNSTDWGVQITRVDGSSSKSQTSSQNSSPAGLSIRNAIPKSLSIEIIPDSVSVDAVSRKGPSPPTVSILPEVVDLVSDLSEPGTPGTQSTIRSVPMSPGPRRLPQGGVRWPQLAKTEILSPPQAVWKEKRSSSQTGENVIIDIQTQEDPQKVPHCPVHCTCGAAMRQGTCMGTMRNLIEEDADCLYEVPLSPEDFEESGAMLALGRGWIESCFDDPEDRDEFFQSYEDILPTVSDFKQRRTKSLSATGGTKSNEVQPQPAPQHVRRVLAVGSSRPVVVQQQVKQKSLAPSQRLPQTTVQKQPAVTVTSSQSKAPEKAIGQIAKEVEQPKKRPASGTLLKEIEKKIKAYSDEQLKKESGRRSLPSRRTSSQSSSSSNSASKSRLSTKKSLTPVASLPSKVKSSNSTSVATKRKLNDSKEKRHKLNASSSGSESPESKKSKCNELARLSIDTGKNNVNRRYRVSVRRSLDHLMTRQKLRSDRRVKPSSRS